jgi:hypothetical protein
VIKGIGLRFHLSVPLEDIGSLFWWVFASSWENKQSWLQRMSFQGLGIRATIGVVQLEALLQRIYCFRKFG